MNTTLKLGVIGGGINSAVGLTHKLASELDNRWEIVAGAFSRDAEINEATGKKYKLQQDRLYKSWSDLLDNEQGRIDAVAILTPIPSHCEFVIRAIELGFPVICEKPLAMSSEEGVKIQEALDLHNGYLVLTYNYTGYPMIRELKHLIHKGALGKIQQIHIEMPQEGFLKLSLEEKPASPQAWRLEDVEIPTVSLDLGAHLHNMIYFLTGENPLKVTATHNTFGNFDNVLDNVMCIAKYSNNIDTQIWYGKTALGIRNGLRVRIYGDAGTAEWFQMNPEEIKMSDSHGRVFTIDKGSASLELANEERYGRFKPGHPAGFIEAFANLYWDIADSLIEYRATGETNNPWVFSVDHANEGLALLEAIRESANQEKWMDVKINKKKLLKKS